MSRRTSITSNTIAFRATPEILGNLDADCRRLGLSRGHMTKAIVSLHYETQPGSLRDDLNRLIARTRLIHRNQARTLVSLLTLLGNVPLEQAKDIVKTELLS